MRTRDDYQLIFALTSLFLLLIMPTALVFFTPSGTGDEATLATVTGESQNDHFGWNVSGAGDVNGDGYNDIIVGAPGYNNNMGKAYIFFGGPGFTGNLTARDADVIINGSAKGDRFGWDVSYAGDVNNDSFDDVIVGAPGNDSNTGAAYIFYGNDPMPLFINATDANMSIFGEDAGDSFGSSVSEAGDVNNDGYDDVIVGAPGNNNIGSAYIFYGIDSLAFDVNAFDANVTFYGDGIGDVFGASVSGAGDVNNDDYDDVIIGAPGANRAYNYFGGDPMNSWIQTTKADFNGADPKIHVNITGDEVKLETFYGIKAMMAYYDDNEPSKPRNSSWNQTSWSAENSTLGLGTEENYWFEMESGTVRKNEKILAVSNDTRGLNVLISDGIAWSHELALVDVLANVDCRGFDVAYETISGRAMVVYYDKNSPTSALKYRLWDGISWTAIDDTNTGGSTDIYWVVLTSNPNSNEILMVTLHDNNEIWAQVWNGSNWSHVQLIDTAVTQIQYQCFDAVYEAKSGYGFIMWANNSIYLKHRRWKGNWDESEEIWNRSEGVVHFIKLASEPNTNHILAAELNSVSQINATVWNGTSWNITKVVTISSKVNDKACFDVAWESTSDKEGLIVYGVSNDAPMYRNVTDTEINAESETKDANLGDTGHPNWIILESDPQSDDIMMMYLVNDGDPFAVDDIGVELWNGTDWGQEHNAETDSTQYNGQRFDLAYTDTSGYFNSTPYDTEFNSSWGRIRWNANIPIGTTLKIRTRTSPNNLTWSNWSVWYNNGDRISSPDNRYIQYQAWFETTNVTLTPVLYDITIGLNHANLSINGTSGEAFGWSLAGAGDLDLDGLADVIIGAPRNQSDTGSVYIFTGNYMVTESYGDRFINLSQGDIANVTLTGAGSDSQFGYSVSFAGNFGGDGCCDILVGAPGAFQNGSTYVFYGGPTLSPNIQASNANFSVTGENNSDLFGWSVSWAGNIDNDSLGFSEIIVGAPLFNNNSITDSGKAYVFHLIYRPDIWINGDYDDVYQDVHPVSQVNLTYVTPGDNTTFWIVVQNDGGLEDTFFFVLSSNMLENWTWEMRENGTWIMINDGDNISLSPCEWRNFTLNISSPLSAVNGDEFWVLITITSQNDTSKKDTVNATTRAIDITLPEIINIQDFPDPQDQNGYVNITCVVIDDVKINEVNVTISGPTGFSTHNESMFYGGGNTYYYNLTYSIAGLYNYSIWTKDSSGNENSTSSTYTFMINDTTSPDIENVQDMPDPQDQGENVNITCTVTDNIEVSQVWVDISGPPGFSPLYVPMENVGGDDFYHNISYPIAGTYTYFIWANDSSGNEKNTSPATFVINDITHPVIDNIQEVPDPQGQNGYVNITCVITDDVNVSEVKVNISGPAGFEPLNESMLSAGGNTYFYNITYSIAGTYTYYIWTVDSSGNENSTLPIYFTFIIDDTTPPWFENIQDTPDPQYQDDNVNITCEVKDNINVNLVMIDILGPVGFSPLNTSMVHEGASDYYFNMRYTIVGTYTYFIWANDTNDNINQSAINQFNIILPPPTIDYIRIQLEPVDGGDVAVAMTYDEGETDIYYACGYNHTYGYQGEVEVNWVSNNESIGDVSQSKGSNNTFTAVGVGEGTIFIWNGTITNSTTFEVLSPQEPWIEGIIRDIELDEDFLPYPLDLSQYARDPQEEPSELKWHLTGVDTSILKTVITKNYKITLISLNDRFGNMEVTYWLEDRDGNSASQKAWINISPVNDAPSISNCPNLPLRYDSSYAFNYSPYIDDIDNTFSELILTCDDTNHTTVNGFVVTYNYPESMLGDTVYVKLTVSDGEGSGSELIEVTITSNHPPELVKTIPDVTLWENKTKLAEFDLDEYIIDPDGDILEMSVVNRSVGITIHEDHTVDFSAKGEWSGTEIVIFRAEDQMGAVVEQSIIVTVIPVNDPPVIKPLPRLSVRFERNYTFDLEWYISDKDNATEDLIISTSNPNNIAINGTCLILFYPEYWNGQKYPYEVFLAIFVSDGINMTSQATIVNVSANFPPDMYFGITLDDLIMFEDESLIGVYNLDQYFFDFDGDPIYYTYGNETIEVIIHDSPDNHTIDFIPPPDWFGSELITIRAKDDKGAFFEDTIEVTVLPVNDPPGINTIPDQEGEKGEEWYLDLTDYLFDIDDELVNLTVSVNSTYVEVVGHVLKFNYPENITEDIIWITVSDGENETTLPVNIKIVTPPHGAEEGPWLLYLLPFILIFSLAGIFLARRGFFTIEDLFLITKSGLLIEHVGIQMDVEKGEEKDEDIIASMFVAVQEFIKDSFGGEEKEDLKRLDYGDKTVLIHRGHHVILAAFITGQTSKPFLRKMRDFVDDVEVRCKGALDDWIGINENITDIEVMLYSLLEGKYGKGNRKNRNKEKEIEEEEEEEKHEKVGEEEDIKEEDKEREKEDSGRDKEGQVEEEDKEYENEEWEGQVKEEDREQENEEVEKDEKEDVKGEERRKKKKIF